MSGFIETVALNAAVFAVYALAAVAITAPVGIWWSIRRELRARRRRQLEDDATEIEAGLVAESKLRLRHLASWQPIALIVLAGAAALGMFGGWYVAIVPIVLSTYLAYRWHITSRRQSVAWANVYALAFWMLPMLACSAMIVVFGASFSWDGNPYNAPDWVWEVERGQDVTQKTDLLAISAVVAAGALVVAFALARFMKPLVSPTLLVSLAFVHAVMFWFSSPFGFLLATLSMVLLGHAISREVRARLEWLASGNAASSDLGARLSNAYIAVYVVVAVLILAMAHGAYRVATEPDLLSESGFGGIPLILSWCLGAMLIATIAWAIRHHTLHSFCAAICGLAWIPISYLAYGFRGTSIYVEDWLHTWEYWQIGTVGFAALVMAMIMWRAFGTSKVVTANDGEPQID